MYEINLEGTIISVSEIRKTKDGNDYILGSLSVQDKRNTPLTVSFFCFGNMAANFKESCPKGSEATLRGKLIGPYTNKQGNTYVTITVEAYSLSTGKQEKTRGRKFPRDYDANHARG